MTNLSIDDHFALVRASGRVRALFSGHDIADSDDVLVLHQPGRPIVRYFPRKDVAMVFLRQTDKTSDSPTKGRAVYFTIDRDQYIVDNFAWSYEQPLAPFGELAGRIAFFPEHVEFQDADIDLGAVADDLEER
jgi:uncharacterized protein (DUF427 family)